MIKVIFFGMLSNLTGCKETTLDIESGEARLSDVIQKLHARFERLPDAIYMYAVNREQAGLTAVVKDGDEVAIMPPFSGG